MSVDLVAYLLLAGLLLLALFQAAIALGAPLGRAAWGGRNPGVLPQNLRIASAVSVVVYLVAVLIVVDRAGMPIVDLPDVVVIWGTWVLVILLAVGAVMNFASSSRYERFGWGPLAAVMAVLALLLALA
jgi:hypothetical protein